MASEISKDTRESAENDFTLSLRSVADADRHIVSAPSASVPYHLVSVEGRALAVIEVIDDLVVESEGGLWQGPTLQFSVAKKLAEIKDRASKTLMVDPARILPILWLYKGIAEGASPSTTAVASRSPSDVIAAVERMTAGISGDRDVRIDAVSAGAATVEAIQRTEMEGGSSFEKLVRAIRYAFLHELAVGKRTMRVMGVPISIDELVDPSFMLPVLAIAAYEDWQMATRKRTHGTGFCVDICADPKAILGLRLVNIRPALPFVVIAPVLAVVLRCKADDGSFVFDDLMRQVARWAAKNDINPLVFQDIRDQVGEIA